jgi:hypothetical protein
VPFGWVADVHRQRAGQDNECLLLGAVLMATSLRTWFVAPDVRTCVREPRSIAQFCHVPRRFARLVWPGDPVERRWLNDAEAHSSHSTARYLPATQDLAWASVRECPPTVGLRRQTDRCPSRYWARGCREFP